jgi:DNA (cytosine-5)-methyltransferase 1
VYGLWLRGVKNVVEALHIPDSDICRCDKCGGWKFAAVVCHTCQLIGAKPLYPDLRIYEQILFLQHYFKGKWVVENVVPYYDYLIQPTVILGRHPYWSNFNITIEDYSSDGIIKNGVTQSLEKKYGFNLTDFDLPDKRKALRNCVNPEMGLHILREAM